jgi:hypothetical protein
MPHFISKSWRNKEKQSNNNKEIHLAKVTTKQKQIQRKTTHTSAENQSKMSTLPNTSNNLNSKRPMAYNVPFLASKMQPKLSRGKVASRIKLLT